MVDIIKVLIVVIFFTSLIGTIADQVAGVGGNVTGAALTIIGLITLFVTIGFISDLLKKSGVSSK